MWKWHVTRLGRRRVCRAVLERHSDKLLKVFKHYCRASKSKGDNKGLMDKDEFRSLFRDCKIIGTQFSETNIKTIFECVQVEEASEEQFLQEQAGDAVD